MTTGEPAAALPADPSEGTPAPAPLPATAHTLVLKVPAQLRHRRVTLTLTGTDDAGNGGLTSRTLRLR